MAKSELYFFPCFPEECAQLCYCNPQCGWWSHDIEFDDCILTEDCPTRDEGCGTCVSGQSGCDIIDPECGERTTLFLPVKEKSF